MSPTYVLEHLATFTVSPENDLVYPADGMRRLLAMEKTNGIWTQKMLMKIERNMINIMDHENKEIVERFPLGLVREPTAFTRLEILLSCFCFDKILKARLFLDNEGIFS